MYCINCFYFDEFGFCWGLKSEKCGARVNEQEPACSGFLSVDEIKEEAKNWTVVSVV